MKLDDNGRIIMLFLTHLKMIAVARAFLEASFVDATYKSNIYGMPLIYFVACIPVHDGAKNETGSNLSTALCFVSPEYETSYEWAFEAYRYWVCGGKDLRDNNIIAPNVWNRDGDPAIGNAIETEFREEQEQIIYEWHVHRSVETYLNETWVSHAGLS